MRVLITGKNSYIGMSLRKWLESAGGFVVDELDMISDEWKSHDFSPYDSVVHVAALVHQKKQIPFEDYRRVNEELTISVARKAKEQGVQHFVFLSTMAVYGVEKSLDNNNIITESTPCRPTSFYGISKYNAECELRKIEDGTFRVAIIRPPNVYGPGCRGNYISGFLKLVRLTPVFPDAYREVKQSMIYIDNLTDLIRLVIQKCSNGTYMPQDDKPVSACEIVEALSRAIGKRMVFSRLLGNVIKWKVINETKLILKIFGGVSYEELTSMKFNGKIKPFCFAIKKTIR